MKKELSFDELTILYNDILTKNSNLMNNITDLKREASYSAGLINSLKSKISKLESEKMN